MKALMVVFDGMADRPINELGYRTPLEAANKPNMDELAKKGICGLMYTIGPGIPPGSDTAHLALLGYDPFKVYTGRGPFEAAGAGIDLKAGDIALRANYATVDEDLVVIDRRAGRIQNADGLEEAIQKIKLSGAQFFFKNTTAHRATLVLRGDGLSYEVTDCDPHEVGAKVTKVKALSEKATKTAMVLNEFLDKSHETLKIHPLNKKRINENLPPANYILLRGVGVVPHLEPLQKRFDIKGACVATTALVRGVCKMAGMEVVDVPSAMSGVKADLEAEREAAVNALKNNDLILLHVKGFDEASHDGDFKAKVEFIERTDMMLGKLIGKFDYVVLAIDHTTPVSIKDHTGDPVPVVIVGPGVRTDDVKTYDELECAKGGLGHILGKDLLPILFNLMGKVEKFGA